MGIDEAIQKSHDSVQVKLTFPEQLVVQPIIHEMSQLYQVVFNIIQADVEKEKGWVILTLSGINEDIDKALYWLYEQNVKVDLTLSGSYSGTSISFK